MEAQHVIHEKRRLDFPKHQEANQQEKEAIYGKAFFRFSVDIAVLT